MRQPRTQIAHIIAGKALAAPGSHTLAQEVAAYLLSERRIGELSSLVRDVQVDWAAAGHVEVIASSAHPLTSDIKALITDQVKQLYPQAKRIIVTEDYDPAIIGGVRLNLADQQLDLSVQAKLNKFKQLTFAKE